MGLEERLLDDGRRGVSEDDIARKDLGRSLVADELLSSGDALADEGVDFINEVALGFCFRGGGVDLDDDYVIVLA